MTVGIIGAGNMGGAIYLRLKKILPMGSLLITDRHAKKIKTLGAKKQFTPLAKLVRRSDVILLAIKPQSITEFTEQLPTKLNNKLIISILAGVTLKKLQALTGAKNIVRTMPNLPAQIGLGVTGWVATTSVTTAERTFIKKMLGALGHEIEMTNEKLLTKLSVISGCGPAYFFYLTELLENRTRQLGMTEKEAKTIAMMTFFGAATLLYRDKKSAAEWRQAVTSKHGVTEAVLKHLTKNKFDKIFSQALDVGIKRSNEISK